VPHTATDAAVAAATDVSVPAVEGAAVSVAPS
jgi:hypothetical protein